MLDASMQTYLELKEHQKTDKRGEELSGCITTSCETGIIYDDETADIFALDFCPSRSYLHLN